VEQLREEYDAVVLATGSRVPRDLPAPGRESSGIHPAMDYLYVRNRWVAANAGPVPSAPAPEPQAITAAGKNVVVIGGGDTGADCVGNALREGATQVVQLELLPQPPSHRPDDRTPWPLWPQKMRLSYAQEEGQAIGRSEADYSVVTTRFLADDEGRVRALEIADAEAKPPFAPVPGTERELPAELVLLAMGFLHPEQGLLDGLALDRDGRKNIAARTYATSVEGVFAAGDCRRGQSLIVWAINEGRQAARMCDRYLRSLDARPADLIESGNVHDADFGPEGPPRHVNGAVPASGTPAG
jgi:glutamate synthase (NADPH) small chain